MTPEEIPGTWCRMWSEDASLAHELLAPGGRQWSGVTPGLDTVVGPAEAEAFVRKYQKDVGNVFTVRTMVIDGDDRLAYVWDCTRRDGSVVTGADVCVLRDGLVVLNWTVPLSFRSDVPNLSDFSGDRRDRRALTDIAAGTHPWHGELIVDVDRQTVGGVWDDGSRGGIAVMIVEDGRVDREWVVPGTRPLSY